MYIDIYISKRRHYAAGEFPILEGDQSAGEFCPCAMTKKGACRNGVLVLLCMEQPGSNV